MPDRAVVTGDCCFVHVPVGFVDCGGRCFDRDRAAGDSVRTDVAADFADCIAGLADIAAAGAGFPDYREREQPAERLVHRTKAAVAIDSLLPAG